MKIIVTKEEFAEMLTHCINNDREYNNYCDKCALQEKCDGAYGDTLTKIIEIEQEEKAV